MAAAIQPDLFHVHEPQLLAPILATAKSRPVIYDVHESYQDYLTESEWIPKWARPVVRFAWDHWEARLVRRCAGVIAVTEPLAQRYAHLNRKVRLVANYPDLRCLEPLPPVERDGITCVFAGKLEPDRGISQMFRALVLLKERGLAVQLALAGVPSSEAYLASLWDEVKSLGIQDQVKYHGVLSKSEALILQHKASIGLIADLPCRRFMVAISTKMLECMSLGLPVVFSDFPLYREVAETTGAGIKVDASKPAQMADAIESLVQNPDLYRQMGEAGKHAVRERFNWEGEANKLLRLYHEILN